MRDLAEMGAAAGALLKERGERIAISESSSGGLISAALLAVPGASAYCLGGMVIYTPMAWHAMRDFNQELLGGFRSATEGHALVRARLIRERFGASWGLGETGATGPTGNRYGDAAGHACLAVSGRSERAITLETGSSDRIANMYTFAAAALKLLAENL